MEQDLFDWLNSQKDNGINNGTGLILAPLSDVQPKTETEALPQLQPPSNEIMPDEPEETEIPSCPPDSKKDDSETDDSESNDTDSLLPLEESENEIPAYPPEIQENDSEIDTSDADMAGTEATQEIFTEPEKSETEPQTEQEQPQENETSDIPSDHEWQERATGFTLSLDEPPPEIWTRINEDDEEPEYEETDSLQGAAYIQIHGRNFTERLHHTLRHRKERAEQRAEAERASAESSHPYLQRVLIYCTTLLMAIGFAFLALWFVGRETPDGMRKRAEALIEAGKFEEAEGIYRRAYRRYPDDKFFIEAVSKTAERAGHIQTAKAAHDEYIRRTSPDILPKVQPDPKEKEKEKPETLIPQEKPLTFRDYLEEANHAYNIGMYNRSLIYFFRAHGADPHDIRPYIGIANAYRMKGMYFDSKRILDEARSRFRRNPDIEMGYDFLREVN